MLLSVLVAHVFYLPALRDLWYGISVAYCCVNTENLELLSEQSWLCLLIAVVGAPAGLSDEKSISPQAEVKCFLLAVLRKWR